MDMSESFRKDCQIEFCKMYGPDITSALLGVIDKVIYNYTIEKRETAITTAQDINKSIVEDYVSCCATNGLRKASVQGYFYTIREFLGFCSLPIKMIQTKDCRMWIQHLQEKLKDTTVECKFNVVSNFLTWCSDEEYIDRNPMRKLKIKAGEHNERKPLTDVENVHMLMSCNTPREKAVCEFLNSTGCRISELAKVMKDDIDFKSRSISIKNAKGGKNRTVFFGAELEIALLDYFNSRDDSNPYVFVTSKAPHHQMTSHSLREEFEKVIERSAIGRKVTPHYMRHTFITNMLNRGAPINEVALIAGHSSVNTTSKVYAHIAVKKLQNTYSQYA